MSDYISRAAVEEVLEKAQIISDGENCGYCTQDVNITAIPAADVVPAKHAHWKPNNWTQTRNQLVSCSRCRYEMPYPGENYCPNCGAKMDEEDDDVD